MKKLFILTSLLITSIISLVILYSVACIISVVEITWSITYSMSHIGIHWFILSALCAIITFILLLTHKENL